MYNRVFCILIGTALFLLPHSAYTQSDTVSTTALKNLSLEELMNVMVTSVSKKEEKLIEAASAIQVITAEDIQNSGVRTIPEALRLASNLQVAQVNGSQWAISARGFNNVQANKLLVLIDGRTVYSLLYGGVWWDVQNVMLEDIDRIEVISGPGGSLWGANAVNGVINIITKSSKETQGLFVEVGYGNTTSDATPLLPYYDGEYTAALRYGGELNEDFTYRVYGMGFHINHTLDTNRKSAADDWAMLKGGFRADWEASQKSTVTFIGNIYGGTSNPDGAETPAITKGDNFLVNWKRENSSTSQFQLQTYYDHTWRNFGNTFTEDVKTLDIEAQNYHQLGSRHELNYGTGARLIAHKMNNLELFGFFPAYKNLYVFNTFLQYDFMLIPDKLKYTIGTKLEYNSYTQFQHQPNTRLTWLATDNLSVWAAYSRAVRNPSRFDRELGYYLTPDQGLILGNPDFRSEVLDAFEFGLHYQPNENYFFSAATFYNIYDHVRSAEPTDLTVFPIILSNGVRGESFGFEFSGNAYITPWLNMRGGYTLFKKNLYLKPGSKDLNEASAESNDPMHQLLLQANVETAWDVEIGTVFRYIAFLPDPFVETYAALDIRLAWAVNENLELSLVGQDLLSPYHTEYITDKPQRLIARSLFGKITCRF